MTAMPTQTCEKCGIGPFFLVERRPFPKLCIDCADALIRSICRPTYKGGVTTSDLERCERYGVDYRDMTR